MVVMVCKELSVCGFLRLFTSHFCAGNVPTYLIHVY